MEEINEAIMWLQIKRINVPESPEAFLHYTLPNITTTTNQNTGGNTILR